MVGERTDSRQILWSERYGNGDGPELMERKVIFATTRCIRSDHLVDSVGHLMETCVSKTKDFRA